MRFGQRLMPTKSEACKKLFSVTSSFLTFFGSGPEGVRLPSLRALSRDGDKELL